MVKFVPYLYLPGTAEDAMHYYKEIFNGEIGSIIRYESAQGMPIPDEFKEKVMHAHVKFGEQELYFSDVFGDKHVVFGNQLSLTINFSEVAEIERVYNALVEGGTAFMTLQDTFWGAKYAKLVDKFGINWDLNCQL